MVQLRHHVLQVRSAFQAHHQDAALGRCWDHPVQMLHALEAVKQAEPVEACRGEDAATPGVAFHLGQPRLDVAAQPHRSVVGVSVQPLGLAANAAGGHHGGRRVVADQDVAWQPALQHRPSLHGREKLRGHVLHAVHRHIHLTRNQGVVEGFGEDARPHALQRPVLDAVPLGLDDHKLGRHAKLRQGALDASRLVQGELAPTRADFHVQHVRNWRDETLGQTPPCLPPPCRFWSSNTWPPGW